MTRFLAELTPEDCQTMRYGTPLFYIQLTITPEDAPLERELLQGQVSPCCRKAKPSPSGREVGMKVHELIELLKQYPLDALVVQARDAEGNGFSPVFELTRERYVPRNAWEGELAQTEEGSIPAVVLWPAH